MGNQVLHDRLAGIQQALIGGHKAGGGMSSSSKGHDREGFLRLECGLPDRVRNPRGQLFGGFTPTYVDMVALFTVHAGEGIGADGPPRRWLATTNMRLDYFEPITGPTFVVESELEKQRGRTHFVLTRFFQDDELAVLAATTIREIPVERGLGDA